ncbi:MAG: type II toxin-antitoxin system RelE/ParE family toxin [Lewinellaceae bacterium]|nr:type II toxin-antitoxin system RelE/ParE family toxin [Lewinellaceae bacterium]
MSILKANPRPDGCVKLTGSTNEFRIRVANYRVLYTVEDKILLVQVIRIRNRKDVY